MRILLIGAAGMIGSRVAAEARTRGHIVSGATRSGRDGTQPLDASDARAVAALASGQDAIVLAARVTTDDTNVEAALLKIGRGVMNGMREAGVGRLIVVGGAGSLEIKPGVRIVDHATGFPEAVKVEALAQATLLDFLRTTGGDLGWTYISPGGMIAPGERTSVFRVGGDQLLVDNKGNSAISAEDYAVGLVDELEKGENIGRRINIGY